MQGKRPPAGTATPLALATSRRRRAAAPRAIIVRGDPGGFLRADGGTDAHANDVDAAPNNWPIVIVCHPPDESRTNQISSIPRALPPRSAHGAERPGPTPPCRVLLHRRLGLPADRLRPMLSKVAVGPGLGARSLCCNHLAKLHPRLTFLGRHRSLCFEASMHLATAVVGHCLSPNYVFAAFHRTIQPKRPLATGKGFSCT